MGLTIETHNAIISAVAIEGFGFAVSQDSSETIFIPPFLVKAHDIADDDVGIRCTIAVQRDEKGARAAILTMEEEDEVEVASSKSVIKDLLVRVKILESKLQ